IGPSSPYCRFTAATASGVACSPSSATAGPPGSNRTRKKTTIVTPNTTGTACTIRSGTKLRRCSTRTPNVVAVLHSLAERDTLQRVVAERSHREAGDLGRRRIGVRNVVQPRQRRVCGDLVLKIRVDLLALGGIGLALALLGQRDDRRVVVIGEGRM